MKKILLITIAGISALPFVVSACKNTLTPGINQIVFPTSGTVSYNKYVQPLYNIACNYSGCHDAADAAGGLGLSSYIAMESSFPIPVRAKDTTNSVLFQRIEGKGPIMPPAPFPTLNQNQIQGIKAWIMQGAQYN